MNKPCPADPWQLLAQHTQARIALGRSGCGQPTQAVLAFGLAHAQARDAVHLPMPGQALQAALSEQGLPSVAVHSRASDRRSYLQRPDLGRRLDPAGAEQLRALRGDYALAIVLADGLSALALERQALPTLNALLPLLSDFKLAPIVLATQARVALGDEVGECLGAQEVLILLGERPGLSSPDSLGAYLTYAPRLGRTDAERNCVSNIRPAGLPHDQAAQKLAWLLRAARTRGLSGVELKDDSELPLLGAGN